MSRHEGVSCDSCLKSNFRCRRYKCLICYDYDLCANCYEEGVTSTRHSSEHPMQCILTRSDFELYYGGEVLGADQPQSFTCPFCKKMGYSDTTLFEHVGAEHTDTGYEVVCPVCAAIPGGEPNLVTDDFAGHLTVEHRTGTRDLISFLDEPSAIRHGGVRRIPHSGRPLGGPRSRRSNMHFSSSGGLPVLSPVGRDPVAELLSQLSGGRLGAPQPSQLQQLQMQIQLERQQVSAARQQLERLPRLPTLYTSIITGNAASISGSASTAAAPQQVQSGITSNLVNGRDITTASNSLSLVASSNGSTTLQSPSNQSQFLLSRFMTPTLVETENVQMERNRADRSQYVHDLLLSTLSNLQITLKIPQTLSSSHLSIDKTESKSEAEASNLNENVIDELPQNVQQLQQQQRGVASTKQHKTSASGKPVLILGTDRRNRTPSSQSVKSREMKSTSMVSKESPDSR